MQNALALARKDSGPAWNKVPRSRNAGCRIKPFKPGTLLMSLLRDPGLQTQTVGAGGGPGRTDAVLSAEMKKNDGGSQMSPVAPRLPESARVHAPPHRSSTTPGRHLWTGRSEGPRRPPNSSAQVPSGKSSVASLSVASAEQLSCV